MHPCAQHRRPVSGPRLRLPPIFFALALFFRLTPAAPAAEPSSPQKIHPDYAGSPTCQNCHPKEYTQWRASNHGLAERPITLAADAPAFTPDRTVLTNANTARIQLRDHTFTVTTTGLHQTQEVFHLDRVIGNKPLQQYLVPFPGGRWQTLEASYDPLKKEWFDSFGAENRHPGEWGHWTGRGMNWNSMCAECHNTRLAKNYDPATDTYHTTMAEPTVSCEACHGPLQAHNDWQAKFGQTKQKDPTVRELSHPQALEYCAACHARRSDLTGDFKPGDRFTDNFSLATVDATETFYPDGQNHDEDYEYTAFLGSKMHDRGVMCLDCHNPHTLQTLLPGNQLCLRCHNGADKTAPQIDPVAHSHHQVFGYDTNGVALDPDLVSSPPDKITQTGGQCINCHMPQTPYMQRHWRHDHGFTSPDPLLTKQSGIPNACNRCHQDKTADWALKWSDQWYGPRMNRPARTRAQWIVRAKTGDPAAAEGLLGELARETNGYWRAVETEMLAPWSARASVSNALVHNLSDPDPLAREAAVRSLGESVDAGDAPVTQVVSARLTDPSRNVRLAAAWTLRATLDPALPAAAELQHYLQLNSDQPAGQLMLGTFAFARNDPTNALTHLQTAVAWDPYSPPLREELSVILGTLNRPREAVDQLQAAADQAPGDAEIHYKLGLARNEAGDAPGALAELATAARLAPHNGRIWYNLALAQNQAGNTPQALDSLLRAESASPSDPGIPYAAATIHARAGHATEARSAARRALAIQPDYPPARELLQMLGP